MAAATFVLLIKSGGGGSTAGAKLTAAAAAAPGAAPTAAAAPAAAAPAPTSTIMDDFDTAVTNAATQTGVTVSNKWAAQGAYDYILLVTADSAKWPTSAAVPGGPPSPQQIAIGFGAALAQNAGVTTETVSVVTLDAGIRAIALHSCG